MADVDSKAGGFGSIPGDLFDAMIKYFELTPPLPSTMEPLRPTILARLARTEHAAANAEKTPYLVDVVFKCVSLQADFLTVQDTSPPELVRKQAIDNMVATLKALAGLWVK